MWMGFTSHQVLVLFSNFKKLKSTSPGLQRSLVPPLSYQWGGRVHNFLGWEWARGKRTTFTSWKSANFHLKSSADWFLELPLAGGPVHHHLPNVLGLGNQGNAFGRLLPHRLQLLLIASYCILYFGSYCEVIIAFKKSLQSVVTHCCCLMLMSLPGVFAGPCNYKHCHGLATK